MDPSLIQPSLQPTSTEDVKPIIPPPSTVDQAHLPILDVETEYDSHDLDSHDEDPNGENADPKRPRLRLAHACDRCRKRKIRCDTQLPCGPCQATKNECTFHTPSRRVVKPKSSLSDGRDRVASGSAGNNGGVKRTHSMAGKSLGTSGGTGNGGQSQATLEARLATLEAMLRDVPPNVHNAFLSTLDARLGSGTGVGLKEGGTEGVGVSVEALASGVGPSFSADHVNFDLSNNSPWTSTLTPSSSSLGINPFRSRNGSNPTLSAGWSGPTATWSRKSREEEGVNEMARRMEGLSFFYEDEIGQAKWQGATSGFPLLDLLTAANAPPDPDVEEGPSPTFTETFDASPAASHVSPPITNDGSGNGIGNSNRRTSSQSASIPTTSSSSNNANGRSASFNKIGKGRSASANTATTVGGTSPERKKKSRFFPDRTPRPSQTLNPEASWKVITGVIPPDLMDTLVRCYLSTSHLLWPFLHVPSFLADYANPQQWGEPGFACFIVAVCTLSSRHVDDPRVRANPSDPSTAGKQYFELFKRLRDLPSADRPTLYSIQAAFLAAIFAFGLGNLSKAFALQAESVTLCLDGGLHRSVDGYDHFDLVEKETRKRTFWSIYSWDKQSAALFGRPPIIHLRDCDVTEPMIIDDESLTPEGVKEKVNTDTSRMCAFVAAIRLHVILEGVIDSSVQPSTFPTSPFLAQAAATIAKRTPKSESLRDEEALLDEWTRILPKYWHYDSETVESRDPIRITQAERLHCLEHLVKMIIYRHRFSGFVALPASTSLELERHLDLCRKAMQCALTIIADHVHISQRGMMTYYGVHVIHQLAQAGRTLVAVVLNCKNKDFRPLISPSVEGLRSCVGLLRRFSGRYLCGLRSADIIDEFCRICNIPVDSPRVPDGSGRPSPAWLRPVRRRPSPSPSRMQSSTSPTAILDQNSSNLNNNYNNDNNNVKSSSDDYSIDDLSGGLNSNEPIPTDLEALFNTSEYFDLSAMEGLSSPPPQSHRNSLNGSGSGMTSTGGMTSNNAAYVVDGDNHFSNSNDNMNANNNINSGNNINDNTFLPMLGEPSAPYDRFETLTPNNNLGSGSVMLSSYDSGNGFGGMGGNGIGNDFAYTGVNGFDIGSGGMGGVDSVADGLIGAENPTQGLSAATILSLMQEGTFDYGSIFTDQAP